MAGTATIAWILQPFLLDIYTGAAAAFSMYKLRSAYSGNCLRVRRDSDNTEQDIGFVNNFLDTTSLQTFVGSNSGYIVTWYDQSGNSNDATNSTTATQPRIVNAGVIDTYNVKTCSKTLSGTRMTLFVPNIIGNAVMNGYMVTNLQSNLGINFAGANSLSAFSYVAESGSGDTGIYSLFGTPSLYVNNGSAFTGTTRNDVFNVLFGNKIININGDVSAWAEFSIYGYNFSAYLPDSLTGEVVIWTSDQSANRSGIFSNINQRWSVY